MVDERLNKCSKPNLQVPPSIQLHTAHVHTHSPHTHTQSQHCPPLACLRCQTAIYVDINLSKSFLSSISIHNKRKTIYIPILYQRLCTCIYLKKYFFLWFKWVDNYYVKWRDTCTNKGLLWNQRIHSCFPHPILLLRHVNNSGVAIL